MKQTIYLLKNDYLPDAGSMIYGAYTTFETAQKALEFLADAENNPWGSDESENAEIDSITLTDDPEYM